jgi:uncharacterized repeat protein (TIGR02543 family)
MKFRILSAALATIACSAVAMPSSNRVTLTTGQQIFVNGINLAWLSYGNDFADEAIATSELEKAMKNVSDSGANSMRIWISTDGSKFKYDGNGYVNGLGTKTVQNLKTALQYASKYNLVLMPTLMTHNLVNTSGDQWNKNKKLLTENAALDAYISTYLVPLVTAIGKDPNLLCWEVFNEPEGLVYWNSANKIQKSDVQRVVNRVAGAIHRAVPGVLVSNGSNQISYKDWYLDAALKGAGGDADGVLDFYMFHYYGWTGTGDSPFTQSVASLGLDKPVVVGEFASSSWDTNTKHPQVKPDAQPLKDAMNIDSAMAILWNKGYAGGLYWKYFEDGDDPWMKGFPTCGHPLAAMYRAHTDAIKISPILDTMKLIVVSSTTGGSATATPSGKVKPGTLVTLVAAPDAGYEFLGWTGDTTAAATVTTFVVKATRDLTVIAKFGPAAGTSLLKNGDFAAGSTGWSTWVDKAGGDTAEIVISGGVATTTLTATGTKNYLTQLYQGGFGLDSGVTYLLSFDASSTGARPLSIGVKHDGNVDQMWSIAGYKYDDFTLSETVQSFTSEFTMDTTDAAVVFQFNQGASLLPVTIDNVVLAKKQTNTGVFSGVKHHASELKVRRSVGGLEWTLPEALTASSYLRVVDAQGRVVARSLVEAGSTRGSVAASLPGQTLFVGLEGRSGAVVLAP